MYCVQMVGQAGNWGRVPSGQGPKTQGAPLHALFLIHICQLRVRGSRGKAPGLRKVVSPLKKKPVSLSNPCGL